MKTCTIDGCENKHRSLGYCTKHYRAFKAHGDPLINKLTPRMLGDSGKTSQVYDKICSIEDCEKPTVCRSWCGMHYIRWQRNGDPLIKSEKRPGFSHLIDLYLTQDWSQVLIEFRKASVDVQLAGIDTACWEWLGPLTGKGYSRVAIMKNGKTIAFGAYRMVLEAHLGRKLHPKMEAHHRCTNKLCVNPEHIQEVTENQNMAEMKARKFYLNRIQELEEALRELDPAHILL